MGHALAQLARCFAPRYGGMFGAVEMVAAELDGDGRPDLALSAGGFTGGFVTTLLNVCLR